MATIKDVARMAGVSVSTASVALSGRGPVSDQTRRRVREAAESLRYRPNAVARSLVTRRTRSIGLVVADLTDPYFHVVAKGIEGAVSEAGYTVVLADTDRSHAKEERSIETLLRYQVDGLILAGSGDAGEARLTHLKEGTIPVVTVGSYAIGLPNVTADNRGAGALVAAHLLEQGYRRIGYVGGPRGLRVSQERWAGFSEVLRGAGLSPAFDAEGDFTPAGGHRAALEVLAGGEAPEAIVAANDQMAIGVINAVKELGLRVPADVAVAGIGDIPTAVYVDPPLTTVALPLKAMGARSAQVLLRLIDGESIPAEPIVLEVTLKVRESTARRQGRIVDTLVSRPAGRGASGDSRRARGGRASDLRQE